MKSIGYIFKTTTVIIKGTFTVLSFVPEKHYSKPISTFIME